MPASCWVSLFVCFIRFLRCSGYSWQNCTQDAQQEMTCNLPPGTSWTLDAGPRLPASIGLPASIAIVGSASGNNTVRLGASYRPTPGIALRFQDLTMLTDIILPRPTSLPAYLLPTTWTASTAAHVTYSNVTIRVSCSTMGALTQLLCSNEVNGSMVITRWGVLLRAWSTAAVTARSLNVTCGSPMPVASLLCTSTVVSHATELVVALLAAGAQQTVMSSYIHCARNISLQGVRPSQDVAYSQDPVAKPKGPIIITGAHTPGTPRPELDWAAWDNMLFLGQPSAQVVLINLTLANMPVGPSNESPTAFFTAAGFMATFSRGAFYPINKLEVINCTLLLPQDEAAWWTWVGANVSDTQYVWTLALYKFQVCAHKGHHAAF
ncbi:hypothetical protein V8C86DRAFT_2723672 [Haematococcus lacustris]